MLKRHFSYLKRCYGNIIVCIINLTELNPVQMFNLNIFLYARDYGLLTFKINKKNQSDVILHLKRWDVLKYYVYLAWYNIEMKYLIQHKKAYHTSFVYKYFSIIY